MATAWKPQTVTMIDGSYIAYNTGNVGSNASRRYAQLTLTGKEHGVKVSSRIAGTSVVLAIYYDGAHNYIGYQEQGPASGNTGYTDFELTVPETARYLAVNGITTVDILVEYLLDVPRKLALAPDADGYSSTDGQNVINTILDGGQGRYRLDKIGASKTVNVKWTMNPVQYQYWRAFYVTATNFGALPFLCDLVSEDGNGPAEHQCSFVPGSVSLPTQQGYTYVQSATLEVRPLPHDADFDEQFMFIFETYGETSDALFASLAYLVNVQLPGYF